MKKEALIKSLLGLVFFGIGVSLMMMPETTLNYAIILVMIYCIINTLYLIHEGIKKHQTIDFIYSGVSFVFFMMLVWFTELPEWLIRVSFGCYCLASSICSFVQSVLNSINHVKGIFRLLFFSILYFGLALCLLYLPDFPTLLLLQFFGAYFILLGVRYNIDAIDTLFGFKNYAWKRKVRVSLPTVIAALMPDAALTSINSYLQRGKKYDLKERKSDEHPKLKILVFTGPKGLQKIGHIAFSYNDIVYSYGNYDDESYRMANILGDGCYFNVPLNYYKKNMLEVEHNSIFEFGIQLSQKQEEKIEKQLDKLKNKSYRWYCKLEKNDGYLFTQTFSEDYPSRLHAKTGAKFYKIKSGKFKYYWFLGDNCASFIDDILGTVGADILSMRGFITPGTYFEFLETEYNKKGSPVLTKKIYPAIIY